LYDAPQEFRDHIDLITTLANQIENETIRVQLCDAIEVLVNGMNGPWHGSRVGWQFGDMPDSLEGLFPDA
jgi:hypothetical protein